MAMTDSRKISIVCDNDCGNDSQRQWAKGGIIAAITRAIRKGKSIFYCRIEPGMEMELAEYLVGQGQEIVIVYPYENFGHIWKRWTQKDIDRKEALEAKAKKIIYADEQKFIEGTRKSWDKGVHSAAKYSECCEWMAENTDVLLVSCDGRYGAGSVALAHATLISRIPAYWVNPTTKTAEWVIPEKTKEPQNAKPASKGIEKQGILGR